MSLQFDVLIAGGGVVGLTAACAMAKRGFTVAVVDAGNLQADTTAPDLRVYAINKSSQNLFSELGVWQRMDRARISPYSQMHVWDALSGAHLDFDSRAIVAPDLGAIIEESVLKQALLEQIATMPTICLVPQRPVDDVRLLEHRIRICSQDEYWDGQLLMVADGAHSPVRQKLQVQLTSWSYKQQALVAMVSTENAHHATAYQVFHPDGPLAFLPLANPHQCSIVWSTLPERAQELMALEETDFNNELGKAFAHKLGKTHLISARHQFPLHMRHVQSYVGKRWLILGDAAHTIHPLAGLGLNVGLADVTSWLNILDKSNGTLVANKLLGAYQRERKNAVWQMIMLMEGLKRLFGQSFAPVVTLRGLGLRACNEFGPIKKLLIQHAAGS